MTPELENTIRLLLNLVKTSRQCCSHDANCRTMTLDNWGFVTCDETRVCTCERRVWLLRVAAVEAELEKEK